MRPMLISLPHVLNTTFSSAFLKWSKKLLTLWSRKTTWHWYIAFILSSINNFHKSRWIPKKRSISWIFANTPQSACHSVSSTVFRHCQWPTTSGPASSKWGLQTGVCSLAQRAIHHLLNRAATPDHAAWLARSNGCYSKARFEGHDPSSPLPSTHERENGKLGVYAIKRVAADVHLPTIRLFARNSLLLVWKKALHFNLHETNKNGPNNQMIKSFVPNRI